MVRLIDADAVYKILESCEIRKATIGNPLTDWEYGYTCGIERAESEIECAPTVEAVPVVRCRECIRWRHSKTNTAAKVCDWDRYEKTENDFCSWAKRKDDD